MGRASLEAMLEVTDLDTALAWHLQSNLHPPVPVVMAGPAKRAIEAVQSGHPDKPIALVLPNGAYGVLHHERQAYTAPPAGVLVAVFRLDVFIKPAEEV